MLAVVVPAAGAALTVLGASPTAAAKAARGQETATGVVEEFANIFLDDGRDEQFMSEDTDLVITGLLRL